MSIERGAPRIVKTPYFYSMTWDNRPETVERLRLPDVPAELADASPKRKAEFALGRLCAANAIGAMSPTALRRVDRNPDGTPHWPDGIVGSITHTDDYVAAAVANRTTCQGIGIDSEKLAPERVLAPLMDFVVQNEERPLLARLPYPPETTLILLFSAKESIYKCLYPLVNRRFDFSAIAIENVLPERKTFRFALTKLVHPDFQKSFGGYGRYEITTDHVHTGVELPAR